MKKFGKQAKFTYWAKLKLAAKLWLNHVTFNMVTHEAISCVTGFLEYSDTWSPFVGEMLASKQESGDPNDPYVHFAALITPFSTAYFPISLFKQTFRNHTFLTMHKFLK